MPQVESEIGYQSESCENTTQCMEEFDLEELADRVLWIRNGVVYKPGGKELIGEYEQAQKQ